MENRRGFGDKIKIEALDYQEMMCGGCGQDVSQLALNEVEAHHILPHSYGGSTDISNCVVLCKNCHLYANAQAISGYLYEGGQEYGRYTLKDTDPSQIADFAAYNASYRRAKFFKDEPHIKRTIYEFREKKIVPLSKRFKKLINIARKER